jgi:hypothetical protein
MGWLPDRNREQAHSYNGIEYNRKKQVGCQAAFASKLTPTEKQKQRPPRNRISSSPLNRMSVSSAAALDLDPRATSEG